MNKISELKEFGIPNLDNYTFVRYIGRGEWTPVFLAQRKTDGSKWALKFLRPSKLALEQMKERGWIDYDYWKRESLNGQVPIHPNIAHNFVDQTNGEKFLAERYAGDRFLDKHLENKKSLALEEIIRISKGIATALDVHHAQAGGDGMAHGDVAAKNIAYTIKGDIILTDFGNATVGESGCGGKGFTLTRAVEEFSPSGNPTKEGDVFSFGSILYRMFTGKYAFEDEITRFEKPEEFMGYLKENPKIWNKTIDEKVNVKEIPKAFRKLLKGTLYSPDKRMADGEELVRELDKTIKSYHKSRPRSRLKRYGLAASLLAAVVGGAVLGYSLFKKIDEQSTELAEKNKEKEYEKKIRMIKLFDKEGWTGVNTDLEIKEVGVLSAFTDLLREEGITDKRYAYAAYLNPEAAYQALQETKGHSYDDFLMRVSDLDLNMYGTLYELQEGGIDMTSRMISAKRAAETRKRWKEIKEKYEAKTRQVSKR